MTATAAGSGVGKPPAAQNGKSSGSNERGSNEGDDAGTHHAHDDSNFTSKVRSSDSKNAEGAGQVSCVAGANATDDPSCTNYEPSTCDKEGETAGGRPTKRRKGCKPETSEHLPCPRCNSDATKFCYHNNYKTNQPRYFCKDCQRYWTVGGSLRDLPPGSGRRKSRSAGAVKDPEPTPAQAPKEQLEGGPNTGSHATSTAPPYMVNMVYPSQHGAGLHQPLPSLSSLPYGGLMGGNNSLLHLASMQQQANMGFPWSANPGLMMQFAEQQNMQAHLAAQQQMQQQMHLSSLDPRMSLRHHMMGNGAALSGMPPQPWGGPPSMLELSMMQQQQAMHQSMMGVPSPSYPFHYGDAMAPFAQMGPGPAFQLSSQASSQIGPQSFAKLGLAGEGRPEGLGPDAQHNTFTTKGSTTTTPAKPAAVGASTSAAPAAAAAALPALSGPMQPSANTSFQRWNADASNPRGAAMDGHWAGLAQHMASNPLTAQHMASNPLAAQHMASNPLAAQRAACGPAGMPTMAMSAAGLQQSPFWDARMGSVPAMDSGMSGNSSQPPFPSGSDGARHSMNPNLLHLAGSLDSAAGGPQDLRHLAMWQAQLQLQQAQLAQQAKQLASR